MQAAGLCLLGGLHEGDATLFLIGPDGSAFWEIFRRCPEYLSGKPDPVDRYSSRVLTKIATATGAEAVFPFGGPPYAPFFRWALESGRCFQSPVQLLVHADSGLFVSFRGALKFRGTLELPPALASPCSSCDAKPCLSACPSGALIKDNYDVAACHKYLDSEGGAECMARGCAVRRACPVGQGRRPEAQSAFHMKSFHKGAAK